MTDRRPRGTGRRAIAAAWTLSLLAVTATAHGQDDGSEARRAFVEGARAVEESRVADALRAFERAYALSGNPAALFNVVNTLWGVGRYREAVETADRMLDAHPDLAADLRQRVHDLRAQARARIARLILLGLEPSDRTRLDGREVTPAGTPPTLRVDPGPHELWVERGVRRPFTWRGELGEGEVRALELTFEPRGDEDAPLLWTLGIGGAVLAIAAAVVIGVIARDAAQLTPVHDRVLRP